MSPAPRPEADPPRPSGAPLGPLALVLVAGSVLLAAAAGWAIARWIGAAEAWPAAVAAGLGMALTAVPLGALLLGLARAAERQPAPAPADGPVGPALSRLQFMELAEREWARARRYGSGAALALIEIDRAQRLAERAGTAAVEAVLRELVHHVAPTLRGADALGRFGEAQLVVFLAHADATGALDVAERIRERIEHIEVPHGHQRLRVTVSVGVAHLRPAHLQLQALLDDGAEAVAAARAAGGNCVRAAPIDAARLPSPGPARPNHRARKP